MLPNGIEETHSMKLDGEKEISKPCVSTRPFGGWVEHLHWLFGRAIANIVIVNYATGPNDNPNGIAVAMK